MSFSLRASFFLGFAVFVLVSMPAALASPDWAECPKGANLIGDFVEKHELAMRFDRGLPLREGSVTTTVKHAGKWRKYWGTALYATFSHERRADLPAGTILRLRSAGNDGGHMPVRRPRSLEELYTSSAVIFEIVGRPHGIYLLTLNGQPYSDIHVRRLERLLPVTMLCAPLGTKTDP